jgi:phospholipid/cholesterol/gamma-HCH transport system substrate-binding protein
MPASRSAAVGAFVIGGLLLFAVGLFLIGDRRLLFGDTFHAYAEFSSIAGLANGATVRVAGLNAGEVESISVPGSPSGRFRVRMRIRSDLHPLVRLDSVASIQNDGLVGNKFVQIETGSDGSPAVADQGTIASREPFDLANLLARMSDTIDTVNETIADLRGEVEETLGAVTDTARTAQGVISDVGRDAQTILTSAERISRDVERVITGVKDGRGTIGRLITDDGLYERARGIAAEAESIMTNLRQATAEARAAMTEFRSGGGPAKGLTADLQQTLAAAREAMTNLEESTEALKRNFLVRGFFNRRGYFDLDDVTVQQYRAGALDTSERRALRIWIRADLLFEQDAAGAERLSDAGRARLDSAMSQFVKYPRTSPLVLEGYAAAVTADARHLLSRRRAVLVRDYVVGKYGLDPTVVATMAMGNEAEDSPSGRTWDGVALAMFVPTSAL